MSAYSLLHMQTISRNRVPTYASLPYSLPILPVTVNVAPNLSVNEVVSNESWIRVVAVKNVFLCESIHLVYRFTM